MRPCSLASAARWTSGTRSNLHESSRSAVLRRFWCSVILFLIICKPFLQYTRMIKRRFQQIVEQALARQAAVALVGPRQVGKTTLGLEIAKSRPALYLDLELICC